MDVQLFTEQCLLTRGEFHVLIHIKLLTIYLDSALVFLRCVVEIVAAKILLVFVLDSHRLHNSQVFPEFNLFLYIVQFITFFYFSLQLRLVILQNKHLEVFETMKNLYSIQSHLPINPLNNFCDALNDLR